MAALTSSPSSSNPRAAGSNRARRKPELFETLRIVEVAPPRKRRQRHGPVTCPLSM